MDEMKFSQIEDKKEFYTSALVVNAEVKPSKNGDYCDLTLARRDGTVNAKVWKIGEFEASCPGIVKRLAHESGLVIKVWGKGNLFNNDMQLVVGRITIATEAKKEDFMPASSRDPEEMKKEFDVFMGSIKNTEISALLSAMFSGEIKEQFFTSPAAQGFHHNYVYGLLEHTMQMCKLADKTAAEYPEGTFDRDILMAGILLHDIGKVVEYKNTFGFIERTDEGRLIGHIVIGAEMVHEAAKTITIDPVTVQKITHIILSHHGKPEFGAVMLPRTPEAFLVHMIDNIDAKTRKFMDLRAARSEGVVWTGYEKMFETEVFFG